MSVSKKEKPPNVGSQWKPGQSGNPLGRPPVKTIAQLAREKVPDIVSRLSYWLEQDTYPNASIRAAEILLDRAFGRPVIPVADGSNHEALELDLDNVPYQKLKRMHDTMLEIAKHSRQMQEAPLLIEKQAEEAETEIDPNKFDGSA